ncbi:MAG: hypothetical protein H0X47_09285 [Nitrospirales bacterium]|nr:hypothetical protein [Nitrospirales bacterium]
MFGSFSRKKRLVLSEVEGTPAAEPNPGINRYLSVMPDSSNRASIFSGNPPTKPRRGKETILNKQEDGKGGWEHV